MEDFVFERGQLPNLFGVHRVELRQRDVVRLAKVFEPLRVAGVPRPVRVDLRADDSPHVSRLGAQVEEFRQSEVLLVEAETVNRESAIDFLSRRRLRCVTVAVREEVRHEVAGHVDALRRESFDHRLNLWRVLLRRRVLSFVLAH
jgi:hypothetical protein